MITVLGATGFIGSHLVRKLNSSGVVYQAPHKSERLGGADLGTVIYCIGLTADFRERSFETVEAHVCKLLEILRGCQFRRFLYLSSTRVYNKSTKLGEEDSDLCVSPSDPSDVYNISKLMGEALIHSLGRRGCVVRLSNVYGQDPDRNNFISRIIQTAISLKQVLLETAMDSEKDYISVNDVVDLLIQIAERGSEQTYNIASGVNTSNRDIVDRLCYITGCDIKASDDARTIKHPPISTARIQFEFGYRPRSLLSDMESLVRLYENRLGDQ